MKIWDHFKSRMKCQRGFVITSLTAGALATGIGGAFAATTAAGATVASGLAIGAGALTAGAVYTGAYLGLKGLMSGGDAPQQQQAPTFDPYAERKAAETSATEETKRRRIAMAKNETRLSDPNEEAKLGKVGLLGA